MPDRNDSEAGAKQEPPKKQPPKGEPVVLVRIEGPDSVAHSFRSYRTEGNR